MEQTVWFYLGVIATLIGLASVASIFLLNVDAKKEVELDNAIQIFEQKSQFACNSDIETLISEKILIPSGAKLFSKENSVCYSFKDKQDCIRSKCQIEMQLLDLSSKEIQKTYNFHEFNCFFEKTETGVLIECKG